MPLEGARVVDGKAFPCALEPCCKELGLDLTTCIKWIESTRDAIDGQLLQSGALIFRGFPIDTAEDFAALVEALGYPNFEYIGTSGKAVRPNSTWLEYQNYMLWHLSHRPNAPQAIHPSRESFVYLYLR